MLSVKRRLCTNCRNDLLKAFQRGFCGPVVTRPALKSFHPAIRWQPEPRKFHVYERLARDERPHRPQNDDPIGATEQYLSDEELKAQFEALNALEDYAEEPGEPEAQVLANAPEQDSAEQVEQPIKDAVVSKTAIHDHLLAELRDLRDNGADATSVAARARQAFGDRLPLDALHRDELKIYTRLFGVPMLPEQTADLDEPALLGQSGEEIEYALDKLQPSLSEAETDASLHWQDHTGSINFPKDFELSMDEASDVDEIREGDDDTVSPTEEEDTSVDRRHPITALGKFETTPRTVSMPRDEYVRPFDNIMLGFNNAQLKDVCERTFGGPGLPDSPLTPRSGKGRQQVAVQLDASQHYMGEMGANAFVTTIIPPAYAAITAALVDARKRLGPSWLNNLLAKDGGPRILDAGAGGGAILAWNEIVSAHWKSLHTSEASPNSPPVSKAVVLAGSNPLRHRAASLLENTTFVPRLPDYVTTRARPTLDDDRPSQHRKQFDVVFSTYSLLPLKEEWERKQYVQNLWSLLSPSGGVLILIEKGIPRGFEAVAGARELLLERFIATPPGQDTHYTETHKQSELDGAPWEPQEGMIIGPCSNHEACPMYKIPGVSVGRKDICSFQQRYIRPAYLQRVLGAKERNHDDVDFSYISAMKGRDLRRSDFTEWSHITDPLSAPPPPPPPSQHLPRTSVQNITDSASSDADAGVDTTFPPTHLLPRLVFPPIKRRSHVILDLCTPSGAIERWTVPRSYGKQAYRDARKAQWGDLWGLGAKTRRPRSLRQGSGSRDKVAAILGGHLKGRGREERLQNAAMRAKERMQQERDEEEEERRLEEQLDEVDAARYRFDNNDDDDHDIGWSGVGNLARASRSKANLIAGSRRRNSRAVAGEEEEDDDDDDEEEEAAAAAAEEDLDKDMDELDHEIEMKLRAWEAALGDKRPLDRQGNPIRQRKPRSITGTRKSSAGQSMTEQDKDVFWAGMRMGAAGAASEAASSTTQQQQRQQRRWQRSSRSASRSTG